MEKIPSVLLCVIALLVSACDYGASPPSTGVVHQSASLVVIFAPYRTAGEFTALGITPTVADELRDYSNRKEDYHIATIDDAGRIIAVESFPMRPVNGPQTPAVIIFQKP